jgi:phage repressor protein C with HTH and peptisase S24 domain
MDTSSDRIAYLRKGMDLTQAEFTDELNKVLKSRGQPAVTRGAVGNWEREDGTGLAMRNMQAIADLTGATIDWVANNTGRPPDRALLRKIGDRLLNRTSNGEMPVADFPLTIAIRAQAAGSTLGKGALILFDLPPLGWLPQLPGLRGLENVYGLEVTGDSMLPMFKPGKPVYVSPHSPVRPGDAVIIIEEHSNNGEAVGFIKIFVADKKDRVVASQLNPPTTIDFMKAPGLQVHRVLDLGDLTGHDGGSVLGAIGANGSGQKVRRGPKR